MGLIPRDEGHTCAEYRRHLVCVGGIRVTVNGTTLKWGPLGYGNSCKQSSDDDDGDDGTLPFDSTRNLLISLVLEAFLLPLPPRRKLCFSWISKPRWACSGEGFWLLAKLWGPCLHLTLPLRGSYEQENVNASKHRWLPEDLHMHHLFCFAFKSKRVIILETGKSTAY